MKAAYEPRITLSPSGPHIFICFSSKDAETAHQVVEFLESEGLKCWISTRDVPPGQNYQETIVNALDTSQAVAFLFSDNSGTSSEIRKELSIAAGVGVPVFPLRLSAVVPAGALRYELATRQWIDLFPDRQRGLRKLIETVRTAIAAGAGHGGVSAGTAPETAARTDIRAAPAPPRTEAARPPLIAAGSRQFDAVRALLARHVGPIAKVLIEKAAAEAQTTDELCERLSAHVRAPADRASFLQAARAALAAKP
jgi:hypothetical protein